MTVPFSDAVARRVPVELMERKEIGDLCAWMTFATVSERVEKRRTSPVVGAEEEAAGCWVAVAWERAGEGTGDGYARYELSAEGERATMAARSISVVKRRYCTNTRTVGIWCGLNYMEQLHIRDVVNVDLNLKDDDEGLAIELDGKNG